MIAIFIHSCLKLVILIIKKERKEKGIVSREKKRERKKGGRKKNNQNETRKSTKSVRMKSIMKEKKSGVNIVSFQKSDQNYSQFRFLLHQQSKEIF